MFLNWFEDNVDQHDADLRPSIEANGARWKRVLCMGVLFATVVVAVTFDEFRYPHSVPLKSTSVSTVPLFNAWTIGWNAKQLKNGFDRYWDAPIFYPSKQSFAFSEPQPATLLVAPVVWASGSSTVAYKAWLVLSLFLNGVFTALLLRRLGYAAFYQSVAGCAVILLPIVHQQIDVLQLVPVWGILWFWSCLFQLVDQPTIKVGIKTGLVFGLCFALCVHHALFLSLVLTVTTVVFVPVLLRKGYAVSCLAAIVVAAGIVLPIVIPIRNAVKANEFERKEGLVKGLSAYPTHYVSSSPRSLVKFSAFKAKPTRQLCIGWVRMAFALIGIVYGLLWGRRKRWVLYLTLTTLVAFAFSQGPLLSLGEMTGHWKPWLTLSEHVPGFKQVRSVYRFAWFVQLSIVLLSVEGLVVCYGLTRKMSPSLWHKMAMLFLVLVPGVILAAEVIPEPAVRGGVPDVEVNRNWINFVRDNIETDRSIVCLPFATGTGVSDYLMSTHWMYFGLEHEVPMVNGYSGFFPKRVLDLRNRINKTFPSGEFLDEFAELDVDLIVVMRKRYSPQTMMAVKSSKHRLELVYEDPVGVDIYRLLPAIPWWP